MIGYYYCSLDTFLNIIKNKQIYLSDPLKMNDSSEIRWYLETLNNNFKKVDDSDSFFDIIRRDIGFDFTFDELISTLDSNGQNSIYISCFSKESDLLSQWRAYAKDGKGVSIGFDLDALKRADNLLVHEVKYTDEINFSNPWDLVAESLDKFAPHEIRAVISENKIKTKNEQMSVFLHEIIPTLAQYKNSAFKEEKEVRLIYCDNMMFENILDSHNALTSELKTLKAEHDFRMVKDGDITEFVRLDFDPKCIKEICIGPKCSLAISEVKNIVSKTLGIDVDVKLSISSYR